ncbi:hypothetical protein E4T49_03711 [Aureobasidium sp. EXF-10728]|nr:hypothetical protein E4T49_03711 [Aureobasidium sp. EXF-10728]
MPKSSVAPARPPRPLYSLHDDKHQYSRDRLDTDLDAESRFEQSIGYTLATEGGAADPAMGAAGTLQIWPKLHMEPYQNMPELDKARFNRLPSNHTDPFLSQPARPRPTLHAAASQPDLYSASRKNAIMTDAAVPPPVPQQLQRSHRVDFSRLFSRHKSKNKDKEKEKTTRRPSAPHVPAPPSLPLPPPPPVPASVRSRQGSDISSVRPASSGTASHRTQATAFDRNATENAKINVRRPPKGIKHWFEAVDSSDDDLPEVVTPAETIHHSAFNPALGPGRSRVAPTSRVTPNCEGSSSDYFQYQNSIHQAHSQNQNLQERSMLNLSSDEEDERSEPPSPPRWADHSTTADGTTSDSVGWNKTAATRQSTFSMQTTMTSGSIPIIHADNLELAYRTPLPPLPAQYQQYTEPSAVPAPLRKQKSYHFSSPGRTRATSITSTGMQSANSASSAGQSHVMAVTQEEMALLEMMRRKRAEMQTQSNHPARRQDSSSQPSQYDRKNSAVRSTASSTFSRGSAMSIGMMLDAPEGAAFPAPPSNRILQETHDMNYFTLDEEHSNRSSEMLTPHSYMLAELEAPTEQLQALCFQQPPKSASSSQNKLVPFENTADPYRLAPDLELSSLDLLPLPARTYSPSLAGTCSSAATPEFSTHGNSNFNVAGSDSETSSEADRYRNSVKTMDSVDMDVYTAWGRLGGL